MAFTVHPVGSNSGFSEESPLDSELHRLMHAVGGRMADFVVKPFAGGDFSLTTSGSSYDVDVAPGEAFVNGHLVQSDSTVTITVDGSATNEVFLVVDNAKSGNAAIEYTSDGTTPSGKHVVKIHEVTTDGSGVTGTTDFRPYVAFRGNSDDADNLTGKKTGTVTLSVDATGTQTATVSFTNPYQTALDDVHLTMEDIGDTGAELSYQRVPSSSKGVGGFDVEINVVTAGASGTNVTFRWTAHGE